MSERRPWVRGMAAAWLLMAALWLSASHAQLTSTEYVCAWGLNGDLRFDSRYGIGRAAQIDGTSYTELPCDRKTLDKILEREKRQGRCVTYSVRCDELKKRVKATGAGLPTGVGTTEAAATRSIPAQGEYSGTGKATSPPAPASAVTPSVPAKRCPLGSGSFGRCTADVFYRK